MKFKLATRKTVIAIFLITCLNISGYTQKTSNIIQSTTNLNEALISKNLAMLNKLIHPQLSYGHSNAWIETKNEFLQNIQSNYIQYKSIDCDSFQIITSKHTATVRYNAQFVVELKDKPIEIKLHVCQTWIKRRGHWVLLSRQSTKI